MALFPEAVRACAVLLRLAASARTMVAVRSCASSKALEEAGKVVQPSGFQRHLDVSPLGVVFMWKRTVTDVPLVDKCSALFTATNILAFVPAVVTSPRTSLIMYADTGSGLFCGKSDG